MAKQKIYRIENDDGVGIYSVIMLGSEYSDRNRHPVPEKDGGLAEDWAKIRRKFEYHFGFSSLKQLIFWFHIEKDWEFFHEIGLVVNVYEAKSLDGYFLGYTQAVFLKYKFELVETISFQDLKEDISKL